MPPLRVSMQKIGCAAREFTLLCAVHRSGSAAMASMPPRTDFHEQEMVLIDGNNIDFSGFAAKLPGYDLQAVVPEQLRAL
jgi:hypothetical protein